MSTLEAIYYGEVENFSNLLDSNEKPIIPVAGCSDFYSFNFPKISITHRLSDLIVNTK